MTDIRATAIRSYGNGRYCLMRVTQDGVARAPTKDGEIDVPFYAGDVIVTDAVGFVLVEPINMAGAVALATEIMEGRSRTITDPLILLKLAAVILAHAGATDDPGPSEAQSVGKVPHHPIQRTAEGAAS